MKLITFLENLKNDESIRMYDKVSILFKIADDYNIHEIMDQIVTDDNINEIVKQMADCESWESLAIFLSGVRLLNQPYYYINGYSNLENLSVRQFYIILDDFIEEIKYNGLENEEI